jgi:hypothetical protein
LSPEGSAPEIHANKVWRDDIKESHGRAGSRSRVLCTDSLQGPDAWPDIQASIADASSPSRRPSGAVSSC